MLKRKPIDTYIRRATAGLPRLERVDTAAEIRVHLLQKTRELMVQGFPREEAEHLAVQEMGPVAATNRALIGHMFTSSLGWAVVAVMLAGAGVWTYLERDWIFWKDTTIRTVPLDAEDLQFALPEIPKFKTAPKLSKFEFYLPRGTKTLEYALVTRHSHRSQLLFSLEELQHDCVVQNMCSIALDQLERTPFKSSILIAEGQQSDETLPFPDVRDSIFRAIFLQNRITPSITRTTWGGTTRTWKIYPKVQNPVYPVTQAQTNETRLTMNTWTPIYSADIQRYKTTYDKTGKISGSINMDPSKQSWDNLVFAVRASNRLQSELKPSRLRATGNSNGITETQINSSEIQQDPWIESGSHFTTDTPKNHFGYADALNTYVPLPKIK
jgi:hypothetical protein